MKWAFLFPPNLRSKHFNFSTTFCFDGGVMLRYALTEFLAVSCFAFLDSNKKCWKIIPVFCEISVFQQDLFVLLQSAPRSDVQEKQVRRDLSFLKHCSNFSRILCSVLSSFHQTARSASSALSKYWQDLNVWLTAENPSTFSDSWRSAYRSVTSFLLFASLPFLWGLFRKDFNVRVSVKILTLYMDMSVT